MYFVKTLLGNFSRSGVSPSLDSRTPQQASAWTQGSSSRRRACPPVIIARVHPIVASTPFFHAVFGYPLSPPLLTVRHPIFQRCGGSIPLACCFWLPPLAPSVWLPPLLAVRHPIFPICCHFLPMLPSGDSCFLALLQKLSTVLQKCLQGKIFLLPMLFFSN